MSKAIEAATEEFDNYVRSLPWWRRFLFGKQLEEAKFYMLAGVEFGVEWERNGYNDVV